MGLIIHGRELIQVDMGITLRRGKAGMAEQFLNDPQVGPAVKKMRGKAVAQPVRPHPDMDASNPQALLHDPGHAPGRNPIPSPIQENRRWPFRCPAPSSDYLQAVFPKRLKGDLPDGNDSLLRAFAHDSNNTKLEVNVIPVQAHKLAHPNARGIKNFQNGAISKV